MRDGMRQWRAGRQNQRVEPAPVGAVQILDMDFLGDGLGAARLAIIPGGDIGAAGDKRLRGGEPGAAKTKSATLLPLNVLTGVIVTSISVLKVP